MVLCALVLALALPAPQYGGARTIPELVRASDEILTGTILETLVLEQGTGRGETTRNFVRVLVEETHFGNPVTGEFVVALPLRSWSDQDRAIPGERAVCFVCFPRPVDDQLEP